MKMFSAKLIFYFIEILEYKKYNYVHLFINIMIIIILIILIMIINILIIITNVIIHISIE